MTTNETTARDRAMAIIAVADADYADALDAGGPSFPARIVDALLAHPEVLRALAGAPDATAIELDEAVRAVVQDWSFKPLRAAVREVHENLGIALDALARAYETEDGGQDR